MRAVHLVEAVPDLNTQDPSSVSQLEEGSLQELSRADNGQTFKSAAKTLSKILKHPKYKNTSLKFASNGLSILRRPHGGVGFLKD